MNTLRNNIKYLLDTCILIEVLHGNDGVIKKLQEVGTKNCAISTISVHELYYGAYRLSLEKRDLELNRIQKLITRFKNIDLSPAPHTFASVRVALEKAGTRIDDFDILIGSSAIDADCTLVTDNIKHLGRIPNIKLSNWIER